MKDKKIIYFLLGIICGLILFFFMNIIKPANKNKKEKIKTIVEKTVYLKKDSNKLSYKSMISIYKNLHMELLAIKKSLTNLKKIITLKKNKFLKKKRIKEKKIYKNWIKPEN